MIERVKETIARHGMFERARQVGVAVSGGADSVCLLLALRELASELGLRLEVLHLNHHLRGEESDEDARFVARLATEFGLRLHLKDAHFEGRAGNLEQAAREARRAFFASVLEAGPVERIALGHTRNDQAETVLFRLLRGAAGAGLAGILPVTAEGLVRPLLEVTRAEVEAYLRARGQAWREDATNASDEFARNRIRHGLLPQLEREWNPGVAQALAHTAEWARAEEEYWKQEIDRLAEAWLKRAGGAVLIETERLRGLPEAAGRRLVRRAIEWVKGDALGVEFDHIAAMLRLAQSSDGSARFQAAGVDAFRSFDWMRFGHKEQAGAVERGYRLAIQVPGVTAIPAENLHICAELIEKSETIRLQEYVYNVREMGCLDWHRLPGPLEVRSWRPGDQLRPIGHAGERKIKELFQRERVPLWERRNWPVVTAGETIVWTRRFGPAAGFQASSASRVILRLQEQPGIGMGTGGV